MFNLYKILIVCLTVNTLYSCAAAQEDANSERDSLPLDESIRYGRLNNGFTYFIKSVPGPEATMRLRLYSKAGGNREEHDQLEFAHAVEHLAFKATENFPLGLKNSKVLKGMDMGMYDLTGTAGTKGTHYYFDAPADKAEALNVGLLWFRDIIGGLKLAEKDIDQVRGELLQELLQRTGDRLAEYAATTQLKSLFFPCVQGSSNILDHYKNFKPENLRRFYKDWYHPGMVGLSIVGDIDDPEELERQIKEIFGDLASPENPRKRTDCDALYFELPPRFFTIEKPQDTSKVLQNNEVHWSLLFREPLINDNLDNLEGSKRLILIESLSSLINGRSTEFQNDDFNFHSRNPYLRQGLPPVLEVFVESDSSSAKEALSEVIISLNQIKKYGILQTEWDQIKNQQINFLQSLSEEKADYWDTEIKKFYIDGEALPAGKLADLREWLDSYSLLEFNDFVQAFFEKGPADIGVIAPKGHEAISYKEKEVRSWIEKAFRQQVEPYKLPEIIPNLMAKEEAEKLTEKGYVDKGTGPSGARELVLENGVKVVLKSYSPVDGSKDRIYLHGFSLRGARCFGPENYFSAVNAPSIVMHSGINGLNRFQLNRFFKNTTLRSGGIIPYVSDYETGILTDAGLPDLEEMLQLVYLTFTKPNKDRLAFDDWLDYEYKAFQEPSYDLQREDFQNLMQEFTGGNSERSLFGKKTFSGTKRFEGVEETNFEKAHELFKKLYGNPKDFTFIISGAYDEQEIIPLVQKYLGNLPNSSVPLECNSKNITNFRSHHSRSLVRLPSPEYYRMKNVLYGVKFIEKAENPYDWKEHLRVEALAEIASHKIWGLRFSKGFSLYMVGVSGIYDNDMKRYEISSTIPCIPEELPSIREKVKEIFSEIKSGVISEEEFEQGIQRMKMLYDAERAGLSRVMKPKLYEHYRYNQPWLDPLEVEAFVKSLTIQDIILTANKYLTEENMVEFVMKDREAQNKL